MSSYSPPLSGWDLGPFNPLYFTSLSGSLTISLADSRYLRSAGGTISGSLSILGDLDVGGSLRLNGTSLNFSSVTGVTPGIGQALKALILDSSSNINSINALTASQLTGTLQTSAQPNITSLGTLSSLNVSGDITQGGTILSFASVTGVTAGTATASKALILDASKNISGINILDTNSLKIAGSTVNTTYITGITEGSATASKALVANIDKDISSLRNLSITGAFIASTSIASPLITGTLQTSDQPNITSLGTLTSLSVTGNITQGGSILSFSSVTGTTAGTAAASKALILDSSLNTTGTNTFTSNLFRVNQTTPTAGYGYNLQSSGANYQMELKASTLSSSYVVSADCLTLRSGLYPIQVVQDLQRTSIRSNFPVQTWSCSPFSGQYNGQFMLNCINANGGSTAPNSWALSCIDPYTTTSPKSSIVFDFPLESSTPVLKLNPGRTVSINSSSMDSNAQFYVNGLMRGSNSLWLGDTNVDTTNLTERKITSLQSTLSAGQKSIIIMGQALSSYNCGIISHNQVANGSGTNFMSIGAYGNDNVLNVRYGGTVGIGTVSPSAGLDVRNTAVYTFGAGSTSYSFYGHSLYQAPLTSQSYGGTGPYSLTLGLYVASNAMFFGSLYCNSDRRLKNNIQKFQVDLEQYKKLEPSSFNFKTDAFGAPKIGLIGQNVLENCRELAILTPSDDPLVEESDGDEFSIPGKKISVDYTGVSVVNISVIQQLIKKIETLEFELNELKNTFQRFEDSVELVD